MIPIKYIVGDATLPPDSPHGHPIVAHICNNYGGWGAGFVMALSKRSPLPEASYRRWNQENERVPNAFITVPFKLGEIKIAPYMGNIVVANMIAQQGNSAQWVDGRAVRYGALRKCLDKLVAVCINVPDASVHMPRIGTGLGGGEWKEIERIIKQTLCAHNIPTTVYDLPDRHFHAPAALTKATKENQSIKPMANKQTTKFNKGVDFDNAGNPEITMWSTR